MVSGGQSPCVNRSQSSVWTTRPVAASVTASTCKTRLADPVGDRVVEALRIARDVGGGDLWRMLRTLSGFLRDDARTRSELESRQAWTVNGARLGVSAPWLVLLFMTLQSDVIRAFSSPAGVVVLVAGALVCLVAYRLMTWLGRLPAEDRILA